MEHEPIKSLRKKDQQLVAATVKPEMGAVHKDPVVKYGIQELANEFELANPDDSVGIWDAETETVRPIGHIVFNSDLGVYILYPDLKQEFIPASMKVKG